MGSLNFSEKRKLESALKMSGGYVLNFSNRTFADFFRDIADIDIYDNRFALESGSKANRMRAFWNSGYDKDILVVLEGLHEHWEEISEELNADGRNTVLEVACSLRQRIGKASTTSRVEDIRFSVALSFPGEYRSYVETVANQLRLQLGGDKVFYDRYFQAQLARPDLDLLLQDIYRNSSDLVVVFLCSEYDESEWCGLEWRAIRDLIKSNDIDKSRIMNIRFNEGQVQGVYSIDGHITAAPNNESDVASLILERISVNQSNSNNQNNMDDINSSSRHKSETLLSVQDALETLRSETRFLWLELVEMRPSESSCSAEIKESTLNQITPAIRLLEEEGMFSFRHIHAYDMESPRSSVFKAILEHVSPQLVNLAKRLESSSTREGG